MLALWIVLIYAGLLAHTLATFVVARARGMRVEELSLGLGVHLHTFILRSGLRVRIALFPGGATKVLGFTSRPAGETYLSVYGRRGLGDRALVALAGPLALALLAVAARIGAERAGPRSEPVLPLTVSQVNEGSAAELAGVRVGDQLLRLGGGDIDGLSELVTLVRRCDRCELEVARGGETVRLSVSPRRVRLGVTTLQRPVDRSWTTAVVSGFLGTGEAVVAQLAALWPRRHTETIMGPVGMVSAVRERTFSQWYAASLLLLVLAMFNLIPVHGSSGGWLSLVLVEALTGRQLSPAAEKRVSWPSMVLILLLVMSVTCADITR